MALHIDLEKSDKNRKRHGLVNYSDGYKQTRSNIELNLIASNFSCHQFSRSLIALILKHVMKNREQKGLNILEKCK